MTYYDPDGKKQSKGVDPGFWKFLGDTIKEFATLSEEQKTSYEREGMALSRVSVDEKIYLGIGIIDKSDELRKLTQAAEALAGFKFHWYLKKGGQIAEARAGGAIFFDPTEIRKYSEQAQVFILLHECGHHVLRHLEPPTSGVGDKPVFVTSNELELAADKWAAEKMHSKNWRRQTILFAVWELFSSERGSGTHPSGQQRIEYIDAVLESLPSHK